MQDQAKRIDEIEGQVGEQTKEGTEYARAKCLEFDAKLRAELDENIPKLLAGFETKVTGSLPGMLAIRSKFDRRRRRTLQVCG